MKSALLIVTGCAGSFLTSPAVAQAVRLGEVAGNNPRYLQVPDSPSLRPANITLECWVHPVGQGYGNTTSGALLIGRPGQGTSGNYLVTWGLYYVVSTGKFFFEMAGPAFGTNGQGIVSTATIPLGGTAHIAATYDGQTMKLYFNGALDVQATATYPTFNYTRPDNVTFGAANYLFNFERRFDGELDEIRIWNTARSAAQIIAGRNLRLCTDQLGLMGHWSFTNNSLLDTTGNANHAAAVTAVSFPAEFATIAACYANCDCSVAAPLLNINDFVCYLNRFATGDPYANCDASTAPPTLNVADFICFMNAYAAGCP